MKLSLTFICFIFGYAAAASAQPFDGPANQLPDSSKWRYDVGGGDWGNADRQYYTDSDASKKIRSAVGGICLDVTGANSANRTPVQVTNCNGNEAQEWTINDKDRTIRALGKCLDVANASTENGAIVQIFECNGSGAQKWIVSMTNEIVSLSAWKCLEIRTPAQEGAQTQIGDCDGSANQKWSLE